jgi:hypothetical protein
VLMVFCMNELKPESLPEELWLIEQTLASGAKRNFIARSEGEKDTWLETLPKDTRPTAHRYVPESVVKQLQERDETSRKTIDARGETIGKMGRRAFAMLQPPLPEAAVHEAAREALRNMTKEQKRQALIDAGIIDTDGKLTEQYAEEVEVNWDRGKL